MRKSKFTDEQIAYAMRQAEQGTPYAERSSRWHRRTARGATCWKPSRMARAATSCRSTRRCHGRRSATR